jgi:hypothetical protein
MKKKEVTFQESQKFSRVMTLFTVAIVSVTFIFGFIRQILFGKPWGNNPMEDAPLIMVTLIVVLFSVSLFFVEMKTIINQDGIYVKIFPLQLKYRCFSWDEIAKAYIRKYRPLLEFGGWGLRAGCAGLSSNKAYNMSGNRGLQLVFTNGKKLLIGTQQPAELTEILSKLEKLNE